MAKQPAPLPSVLANAVEDYEAWSDKLMRSVQKRTAIEAPLYHYTTAAGLKGILEHQKFWFTDYPYLNDPTEMHHGTGLAHTLISRAAM